MRQTLFLFTFALFALPNRALGQACFTLNDSIGCAPFQVQVSHCTESPVGYILDLNSSQDILNLPPSFDTTYSEPGVYRLAQITSENDSLVRTITVLPTPEPEVGLLPCNDLAVSLSISDTVYDSLAVDYGDGRSEVIPANGTPAAPQPHVHNYGAGGTFSIQIQGLYQQVRCGGTTTLQTQPIQALTPPDLQQLRGDDQGLELTFSAAEPLSYQLQASNNLSGWQTLRTFTASSGEQSLNFSSQQTCFRLLHQTPCGDSVRSDTLCRSRITGIEPAEETISLRWDSSRAPGFQSYQLLRNQAPRATLEDASVTAFTDQQNIVCGTEYCYRLRTQTRSGQSLSAPVCALAVLSPLRQSVVGLSSSYEGGGFVLRWSRTHFSPDISFKVFRKLSDTSFVEEAEVGQLSYEIGPEAEQCYRLRGADNCGQVSPPSVVQCPFRAVLNKNQLGEIKVSPSGLPRWEAGIERLEVRVVDESGNIIRQAELEAGQSFVDNELDTTHQALNYQFVAHPADSSLRPAFSKPKRVVQPSEPVVPTAFSPNGDGINEIYRALTPFAEEVAFWVFNQWGEAIYKSEEPHPTWDGSLDGTPAPEGSYIIKLKVTDQVGQTHERSTSLTLIR